MNISSPAESNRVPHSWELKTWPPEVWPHTRDRASWVAKAYRSELLELNALSRVGTTLVFIGAEYTKWLKRRSRKVVEFQSNNPGLKRPSASSAA